MKETSHIFMLMLLFLACCITSCSNHKQQATLNRAESLMEAHPDSALTILEGIEKSELGSKEEQARYALLMSMALDKNYIESTSFDVIQPAIDYYLKSGNPNEQLRTYYYQGRIFQNKKDLDNALNSFVKGINNSLNCTDSLTLIRTLVAQAYLYYEFYDFDSYTKANLRAATICKKLSHKNYEFQCLLNALNGAILLENKNMADSLINLCNSFESLSYEQDKSLLEHQLSYNLEFGSKQDLASLLSHKNELLESDINCTLNLAAAYNKFGDNHKSKDLLDYISNQDINYDTLKYQSIYVAVLKDIGDYKNALSIYEDFSRRVDALNSIKFDQKSQSIEEKYQIELQAEQDARKKNKIIWSCITGIIFLVLIVVILFLLFRSNKTQKDLANEKAKNTELENKQLKSDKDKAIQEAKIKDLENDRLKSEKDKAISEAKIKDLENENLKAERDKKALEAENLAHRVEILENESASLKELMDSQEELPSEVQDAIKVRIEMLNALMAGYITNNDQYEKPYESWIKELTNNTEEFMNSNRLAFQVSHPRFIQYFEDHDLTISEINYVCLYAIGLRGKEVGNYIKKRSHVNISSGIRKKLGIDKHETNIGIYVRKLLKKL
ncbi:MAG: hypothetical protein K2M45_05225 [Muribaculaceae bacterium]|nr:hypothetical protein [Muribaculaceae bacterium]